jgi:hypothetical protein
MAGRVARWAQAGLPSCVGDSIGEETVATLQARHALVKKISIGSRQLEFDAGTLGVTFRMSRDFFATSSERRCRVAY